MAWFDFLKSSAKSSTQVKGKRTAVALDPELPTVFVDCDETLVSTKAAFWWRRPKHGRRVQFKGHTFDSLPRPSAHKFLSEMKERYQVCLLSAGRSDFQAQVLQMHGLHDLLHDIRGYDNAHSIVIPKRWVLVDNLPPYSQFLVGKFAWLGVEADPLQAAEWDALLNRHYLQCHAYLGVGDPVPLTSLVDTIHERLAPEKPVSSAEKSEN